MKCRLLRDMPQRNPVYSAAARSSAAAARLPYDVPRTVTAVAGTEIEHPDAWRLVRLGVAEPADDDCRSAADVSPEELVRRAARYERLNSGRGSGDREADAAPAGEDDAE